MGYSKKHFIEDGENVGSYESDEAIKRCYSTIAQAGPPTQIYVNMSAHEKETWEYLKLTEEEKQKKEDQFLANYGI